MTTDALRLIPLFKNLTDDQRARAAEMLTEEHEDLSEFAAHARSMAHFRLERT